MHNAVFFLRSHASATNGFKCNLKLLAIGRLQRVNIANKTYEFVHKKRMLMVDLGRDVTNLFATTFLTPPHTAGRMSHVALASDIAQIAPRVARLNM